jgi:hypothetical protein
VYIYFHLFVRVCFIVCVATFSEMCVFGDFLPDTLWIWLVHSFSVAVLLCFAIRTMCYPYLYLNIYIVIF